MIKYFAIITVFAILLAPTLAAAPDPMADVSPNALLRADQFDKLETYYDHYFKNYNPRIPNSYLPVTAAIDRMGYSSELLTHFDKWVAAKPKSHFAYLLRGEFYVAHGWAIRGIGGFNTVSPEVWRLYEQRLSLGDADLTQAAQLNPNSPFPYASLLRIDRGISHGLEAASKHLVAARSIDPSYYPAYFNFMRLNTPRWGGSHATMKEFAENNADKIPGSNLQLLWIDYHYEMCMLGNYEQAWWDDPSHWAEVDRIFKRLIPMQPDPNPLRSLYAEFARYSNHFDLLREQLNLIGPNWFTNDPDDWMSIFRFASQAWPDKSPYQWMVERATAELQKNPRSAKALLMRGRSYQVLRQYPQALADLNKAYEIDPSLDYCWREFAFVYSNTNQKQPAINAAEHFMLSHPSDPEMVSIKATCMREIGRTTDSITFLENIIAQFPSVATAYYNLAQAQYESKKYEATIQTCKLGVPWASGQADRGIHECLELLSGNAFSSLNKQDEALIHYANALDFENGDFMLRHLAIVHHNGGAWAPYRDQIVKVVEEHYKGYPNDKTKHDQALATFKAQITARPKQQTARMRTGAGNSKEAAQYYEAGWQCANSGDFKKGIEYARKSIALRRQPWAPAYSQLGVFLMQDGQKDEARKAFEQALQIDPKDSLASSAMKRYFGK